MFEYLRNGIEKQSRGLYHISDKGRRLPRKELITSFIQEVKYNVNRKIPVELAITFTPWQTIGINPYTVKLRPPQ